MDADIFGGLTQLSISAQSAYFGHEIGEIGKVMKSFHIVSWRRTEYQDYL